MYIVELESHRIAVSLHAIAGCNTYPSACRKTKFQTRICLGVIEIETRYTKRDILQFPLFIAHYITIAERAVVDTDIIETYDPVTGRCIYGHGVRFGKARDDIREIQFIITFEHLSIKPIEVDSADIHALGEQLRISNPDVETIEGDEVGLSILFLTLEAFDGHSAPEGIDDHEVCMQLSAEDLFAFVIDHMFRDRRGDSKYQCKEEHYC